MPLHFDLNSTPSEETSIQEAAEESIRSLQQLIRLSSTPQSTADFHNISEQTISNCNRMISTINRTGRARFRQAPVAVAAPPEAPKTAPEPAQAPVIKMIDFTKPKAEFWKSEDANVSGTFSNLTFCSSVNGDGSVTGKLGPGILFTAGDGSVTGKMGSGFLDTAREESVTEKLGPGILYTAGKGKATENMGSSKLYIAGERSGAEKLGSGILYTARDGSVTGTISSRILYHAGEGSMTGKPGPGILNADGDGSVTGQMGSGIFFAAQEGKVTGKRNSGDVTIVGAGSVELGLKSSKKKKCSVDASDKRGRGEGRESSLPMVSSRIVDATQDQYSWRKYGEKRIKNSNPRSYYKCSTFPDCPARKFVQRDMNDSSMLIVSYKGEHDHNENVGPIIDRCEVHGKI